MNGTRRLSANARAIAFSHVPLEIWWSRADPIVVDQAGQSGLLYGEIKRIDPSAPVRQFVGRWGHCAEISSRLPTALELVGLG